MYVLKYLWKFYKKLCWDSSKGHALKFWYYSLLKVFQFQLLSGTEASILLYSLSSILYFPFELLQLLNTGKVIEEIIVYVVLNQSLEETVPKYNVFGRQK